MAAHKLDALVAPTGGPAWLTDLVNGDYGTGGVVDAAGRRRISAHHRAGRLRVRTARRHLVLRKEFQRDDADRARLRVRAGHETPRGAAVPAARRTLAVFRLRSAVCCRPQTVDRRRRPASALPAESLLNRVDRERMVGGTRYSENLFGHWPSPCRFAQRAIQRHDELHPAL